MSIGFAFALVALGAVISSIHHWICRKVEADAYNLGYKQAMKEEKLANKYRDCVMPQPPTQMIEEHSPTYRRQAVLPDGFAESLQSEGHAAARIR